jgi:TonB family protein
MQARQSEQDQPYISRDPVGHAAPSTPSNRDHGEVEKKGDTGPVGNKGKGMDDHPEAADKTEPDHKEPPAQPLTIAHAKPTPTPTPEPATPEPARTDLSGSLEQHREIALHLPPEAFAPPQESPESPAHAQSPAPDSKIQDPSAGSIGSPDAGTTTAGGADPAPQTDSESDPFSIIGSVEFRPGKMVPRFGRKVKTVRPRLDLAGQYDLLAGSIPRVILRVRADETGRVREVTISKSSGSEEIDRPCIEAMYQWWFEPLRDKQGRPQPTVMLWTLSFYVR